MKVAKTFTMQETEALGLPEEGSLAVPVFGHGTLEVEWYAPDKVDGQKPHSRDEIYVVAKGAGEFFDGQQLQAVSTGTCLFVPANVEHRFENFTEDFAVWVFFYGPEGGEKA
jgi:mannose-6-phosphate isomerase-like protein (cupin superfamily)